MLDIFVGIVGIVSIVFLGSFALAALLLTSGCDKYEDYSRKSVENGRKNEE